MRCLCGGGWAVDGVRIGYRCMLGYVAKDRNCGLIDCGQWAGCQVAMAGMGAGSTTSRVDAGGGVQNEYGAVAD